MTPQEKDQLDQLARKQQMIINTRLTALQSAQTLMGTPGYTGIPGARESTGQPMWIAHPGSVDHVTLLAIAGDIEKYILGGMEKELEEAIVNAGKLPSKILKPVI